MKTDILEFYNAVHFLINVLAISFNGLLLFIIYWRTPKYLKKYSFLIINFTVCDLCCAIFDSMLLERVIPYPNYVMAAPYGLCQRVGTNMCSLLHAAVLHCHEHSMVVLGIMFWYRERALLCPPTLTRVTIRLCIGYIPSVIFVLCWSLSYASVPKDLLKGTGYERLNLPHLYYTGPFTEPQAAYLLVWCVLSTTGSYIFIGFYSCRINSFLRSSTSQITRKVHTQLTQALRCQALTPSFAAVGLCCYFSSWLFYPEPSPFLEIASFFFASLMPMCNPLLTLYFVVPYRRAVMELFYIVHKRKRITSTTTTMKVSTTFNTLLNM